MVRETEWRWDVFQEVKDVSILKFAIMMSFCEFDPGLDNDFKVPIEELEGTIGVEIELLELLNDDQYE